MDYIANADRFYAAYIMFMGALVVVAVLGYGRRAGTKSPLELFVGKLPPRLRAWLGWRDRAEDAERALRAFLAARNPGDRDERLDMRGKAMAALSYLASDRLIELMRESREDWLRERVIDVLSRRALTFPQIVKLWEAAGDAMNHRKRAADLCARLLAGQNAPRDLPADLLESAAEACAFADNAALELLLDRRPPGLEKALWFFHRGALSPRLLSLIREELEKADFERLARAGAGIGRESALWRDFESALAQAASKLASPRFEELIGTCPEHADILVVEVVRRLGHLSSPIAHAVDIRKDRPRRGDADDLRELSLRLLEHARLEEAEALLDEILELELRRSRAGLGPLCHQAVAAMLQRYPTGVIGARAADALGLIGTRASIDALLEAAASLDENIRRRALQAVAAINARASRKAAR